MLPKSSLTKAMPAWLSISSQPKTTICGAFSGGKLPGGAGDGSMSFAKSSGSALVAAAMPLVVRRELRNESEAAMQTETHLAAAVHPVAHRAAHKKTEGAIGRSLRAALGWAKASLPQVILLVVWGGMLFVTYVRVRAD